jgi:protein ImuA
MIVGHEGILGTLGKQTENWPSKIRAEMADPQLTRIRYKRTLYLGGLPAMSEHERESAHDAIPAQSRGRLIQALRDQIARLEGARRPVDDGAAVSSGCEPLDRLLPGRGFRRGTLVEWLAIGEGSGAETLALHAAREACRDGGALVVLDRAQQFYPPAAARLGIELERMILVRARNQADHAWALDQALRCPAVAAVLAWPEKLDEHTFRRLQLAVEQAGGLGLLVRPERVRHEPSWAEVRLLVEPRPAPAPEARRRLSVCLLRSPGGTSGRSVELEIDDETHPLHPASPLAAPADRPRAAGA